MYKLFIILIVFTSVSVAAKDDYSLIEKGLKNYARKVHNLKQNIDNSVFNDQEILLELEFETDQLITFVQEKIAFQPYDGLLRGVQGTINSRAGNALDQSVLLAKLLNDAGLEARIAVGQLSDAMSLQLLSAMAQADIPQHIGQGMEFDNALKALTTKTNSQLDWRKTETYARYKNSHENLSQILKQNSITLNNKDVTDQLVQQSKDYFWVQYRSNPTDTWHDAHPAFNQASSQSANLNLKAVEHFKESVPEKYLHQLKVEAFIEQRIGTQTKQHSLMKPWIKPIANLQDKLITYSNAPSGVSLESDYDLTDILDKSRFFTPTFNGNKVGGKVFDLNGHLVDAEAASAPAGALFKTLGDKTLSAVDKLSAMESSKGTAQKSMQLISQWLAFTFIYPDGTEYVQKRYIYQAPENQKIDDLTVKTQLMTEYTLLVNSGEKPNAYLAKVYIDLVESGLPLLNSSAKKVFNPEQKVGFPKQINRNEFELLTQYYWMQQNPDNNKNTIQFRSQANLLGFKRGYVNPDNAFLAVDIIANKHQFLQKVGGKIFNNPQAAFAHGIWETASEWVPAKISGISGNEIDTLKVSSAANQQNITMQVLKPQEEFADSINAIFQKDKSSSDRIRADLNLGYMVVVPVNKPKGLDMSGWWRINLETGETLGMTADGGGQSATEYAIDLVAQQLSLIRAIGGLKKCTEDDSLNGYEKMCCLAEAHLNNVGGMVFGAALGSAVGSAGAAVFDIADFTGETATGTGLAPSTGGKICKAVGPIPDF